MRAILAATALALAVTMATAQTFVPRFDRPDLAHNAEPSVFGAKSDLETSMGRVAEAPRLMPVGASASMAADPVVSPASTAMPAAPPVGIVVALVSLAALGWRLRGYAHGLGKG